jgi:hypothetical protein
MADTTHCERPTGSEVSRSNFRKIYASLRASAGDPPGAGIGEEINFRIGPDQPPNLSARAQAHGNLANNLVTSSPHTQALLLSRRSS